MRKISRTYEHWLDNLFIDGAEVASPALKRLGATPNAITFVSLIFGVLAIYCLWKGYIIGFALAYLLSHFADCADGHFARKYGMTSKFGDYFDHGKDAIVFLGVLGVFIYKFHGCLSWCQWILIALILGIALLGMVRQLGCQEKVYHGTKSATPHEKQATLSAYTKLCNVSDPSKEMGTRKWLGCGNFVLVVVLVCTVTMVSQGCP
jgi:phosphatidylglycerophosphate synthase